METLELELVKTEKFSLTPFGKFIIKWNPSKRVDEKPNIINYTNLNFDSNTGMPYTAKQEKEIVKYMIKHKTDILISERGYYYTRAGENIVKVSHNKITQYAAFLFTQDLKHSDESWASYLDYASKNL